MVQKNKKAKADRNDEGTQSKKSASTHKAKASQAEGISLWLLIIPFALPTILLAILSYFILVNSVVEEPSERMASAYVNHQAQIMVRASKELLQLHRQRVETAVHDQNLLQLVQQRQWQYAEQVLKQKLPQIKGLRVLPADINRVDADSVPPINNIVLDNIRRIREGEKLAGEMMRGNDQENMLVFTLPLRLNSQNSNQIIGFALVAFEQDILKPLLQGIKSNSGYWELAQIYGQSRFVASSYGDAGMRQGNSQTFEVGLGHWTLEYWSNMDEFLAIEQRTGQLFTYQIALGVMGSIMVLVLGFLLVNGVEKDIRTITRLLIDHYGERLNKGSIKIRLRLFNEVMSLLVARSREVKTTAPAKASQKSGEPKTQKELSDKDALDVLDIVEDNLPKSIFRAYDIRGIVGDEIDEELTTQIGMAIGSEAYDMGQQTIIVARDGRTTGPKLLEALKDGLKASGRDVIDIGEVPTPVLYYATHELGTHAGVMVTGSHNPAEYNGFKIVLGGDAVAGEGIQKIYQRISDGDFMSGSGKESEKDVRSDYMNRITSDVALAQPLKVVIDCGNGVTGNMAPQLLQMLGCEVVGLYCEVDGNFPNHHPDPSKPQNLQELIELVREEQADIGIAFDGDGDRIGVVASDGTVIWPDRQMMLYSMDLLNRHPGADIIFDVKCSRNLASVISANGGRPIMHKTGHSFIKAKMKETGALLAGEQSGHIFFKERWYGFDDALYASARLLEILANDFRKSSDIFAALPNSINTPELNMAIADDKKFEFVEKLASEGNFRGGNIFDIDGVRVEFDYGWGLVRASNTTPNLVLRFEADDKDGLQKVQEIFREELLKLDPELKLPF